MQTPGQDLFRAILRASKGSVKSAFSGMGVTLEWVLENAELKGTFSIPIKSEIDPVEGEYIVTAEDFIDETPPQP